MKNSELSIHRIVKVRQIFLPLLDFQLSVRLDFRSARWTRLLFFEPESQTEIMETMVARHDDNRFTECRLVGSQLLFEHEILRNVDRIAHIVEADSTDVWKFRILSESVGKLGRNRIFLLLTRLKNY